MTEYNETALAPATDGSKTDADLSASHARVPAAHEEDWFKPCAVIPVYNHERTLPEVVAALLAEDLPCILVDDGSHPVAAKVIDALAAQPSVHLVRHAHNRGKGGAVVSGLREAARLGFSHALQVDADGQHDLSAVGRFLDRASQAPDAVVCGYPQFDASIPASRRYGRYLTQAWVWINTLSTSIRDSMCGFRVYPLATTLALTDSVQMGSRMDFDSEILVRMHWQDQPMVWLRPACVIRPMACPISACGRTTC